MPRALSISRVNVSEGERTAYVAALGARRHAIERAQGHFWVFERDGNRGEFVEFVEAAAGAPVLDQAPMHPSAAQVQRFTEVEIH